MQIGGAIRPAFLHPGSQSVQRSAPQNPYLLLAPVATSWSRPRYEAELTASDPGAMGLAACSSGRGRCGGCARVTAATSTFASIVWASSRTRMTHAPASGAPSDTACSFDSRPPRSIYNGGATARAANRFAQGRGPSPASNASSTSAPHVPQRASPLRRIHLSVVPRPNGVARNQRRPVSGRLLKPAAARGLGRPNAAGAPNIVAPVRLR